MASTALFLPNRLPLLLSVPVLLWLLGYSYAKRFTSLAHFWLGAALMLAPMAAWIALRGDLAWPPVLLGLAVLFWVSGFDIIYACQDAAFDREAGLHSLPGRLGVARALRVAAACHAVMIAALVALGLVVSAGPALLPRRRRGGRPAHLRACPGAPRRPHPGQRGVLPGQYRDQHRAAGRRGRRSDPLLRFRQRESPDAQIDHREIARLP